MLGKVFARFVEKRPISVMVRGTLERVLGAQQLDAWFARTAQKQYTRTVLFSTVYDVLSQVVFRIKPSVRAAYQDHKAALLRCSSCSPFVTLQPFCTDSLEEATILSKVFARFVEKSRVVKKFEPVFPPE